MPRCIRWAAVGGALLLAVLQGCATGRSVPALPSTLEQGQGLLVARFCVLGMQAIESAGINVDGHVWEGALREGYLALPLRPGEHELKELRAMGQLLGSAAAEREPPVRPARGGRVPTYIYIPSYRPAPIHYTTLDVHRRFQIEAGRITNLGLIVYVPAQPPGGAQVAQADRQRQFKVFALDNGAEARGFLETNYPELTSTLKDREPVLAPYGYFDLAKLADLRRTIAFYEQRGPHVVGSQNRSLIFGRAGTLVELTRGAAPDQPRVQVLDTGTLADVVAGIRQEERYTFVTASGQLFTWDGRTLGRTALPGRLQPVALAALGERGLAVVDNRLHVLTAAEPGAAWKQHDGLVSATPRSDLQVASDANGAYLALGDSGVPTRLYFLGAGGVAPMQIPPPMPDPAMKLEGPYLLVARPAGLFILHFEAPTLFFRPASTRTWSRLRMPAGKCSPTGLDEEGKELAVQCGGVSYRSLDSGATWSSPAT